MAFLTNCPERTAHAIVFAIITGITFIIVIGMIVSFVMHLYKTPKKFQEPKLLFVGTLMYLILNASVLFLFIPYQIRCDPLDSIYPALIGIIPGPICCLMVILWYFRLHLVFSVTSIALSRVMIIYWYIYFAILFLIAEPIHFISGVLLMANVIKLELWSLINTACFFWIIVGVVSVTILFVIKLSQAYKHIADDDKFIQMMTKISILTAFSFGITIISTLINTVANTAFPHVISVEFVKHYFWTIDHFTNSLCMMLSYSYCNKWYTKLCNCPHSLCHKCWKGSINISEKKLAQKIQIESAQKAEIENTQNQTA